MRVHKNFFQLPKEGDVVEGKVLAKESGAVYVDLGPWGTGIVYGREYFRAQDILKTVKVGDALSAKIVEMENDEGYRELSMKEAGEERSWGSIKQKQQTGSMIDVKVTGANRGGLMAEMDGVGAFLPVSQLSMAHYPRVEGGDKEKIFEELKKFVGQTLHVRVIDSNPTENKLIISEKAVEQSAAQTALSKYKVGDIVEGAISGVVDFGAFLKFDPMLEGLIHISELDWQLIENPRDVVKVGDHVQAKIVEVTPEGRISLSCKALKPDPWEGVAEKYPQGSKVKGDIKRINTYGALVRLDEQIQGLVHVSEFASEEAMREQLKEGEKKEFEVLSVDAKEHRIALRLTA